MHFLMRTNQTIRAMLSAFLLLVFLTGITPRQYWHDLLADHRDVIGAAHHSEELKVSKTGFNCGWNNEVATTSPFIQTEPISLPEPVMVYRQYASSPFSSLYLTTVSDQLLRGPPAIG